MKRVTILVSIIFLVFIGGLYFFAFNPNVQNDGQIIHRSKKLMNEDQDRKDFEAFDEEEEEHEFDQPNLFMDYEIGIRTRYGESGPQYAPDQVIHELQKAKSSPLYQSLKAARTTALDWAQRGPANVPGRTRALIILPQDVTHNTWVAGGVGGGIWKTNDGGTTWQFKTPNLPSMAISWLALCKNQPDIMYASTGETIGGGVGLVGKGLLKSTDGGETWNQLSSTAASEDFTYINRVTVAPDNPDLLFICTSYGQWQKNRLSKIFRSTDGGTNWQEVYHNNDFIYQIIGNPRNFKTIYATVWGQGVVKTIDGGDTWISASNGMKQILSRVEINIAATDTARLYASVVGNFSGGGADLYVSKDAAKTWNLVNQNYAGNQIDFLGGQGDYDNIVMVNPYNEDEVYYGGVNLWKTNITQQTSSIKDTQLNVSFFQAQNTIWDLINFGGNSYNGKIDANMNSGIDTLNNIAVITGPGISQKAYRFTVNKQGAGVPDNEYSYQDYVDIPIQVWDLGHHRQLMVSFRDQQEDGTFNLISESLDSTNTASDSREYLFIHAVNYSDTPDTHIARNGGSNTGQNFRQLYFFWPVLNSGTTWNPPNLAIDSMKINFQRVLLVRYNGELTNVSDAYLQYDSINSQFGKSFPYSFHPDHHNLVAIDENSTQKTFRIVDCSDGGIYISNISSTPGTKDNDWTFVGFGYNTGQFYSADKKHNGDQYIGGLQDNGTWISPDNISASEQTNYNLAIGGDGFDAIWNYSDSNKIIGSSQFNAFLNTKDGGKTWNDAGKNIGGTKPFFSKLANSNSKPDVLFTVSSKGVYRSEDFGDSWQLTSISTNWGFSNFVDVKVSLANSDIVWAGSGMSPTTKIFVSADGGTSFHATANFAGETLGNISGLATHPTKDSTAFALFSFSHGPKILRTNDLGQTWEDITGFNGQQTSSNGFPDVAVYCLLVRPDEPNVLWAGTEIGIFESLDDGQTWSFLDSGLGATAVWDMKVVDDQVVIATHGRGIFTATLPNKIEVVQVPSILNIGTAPNGKLVLNVALNSPYDSTAVHINSNNAGRIGPTSVGTAKLEITGLSLGQSLNVELISFRDKKKYAAIPISYQLLNLESPQIQYYNNFNQGNNDFEGDGFSIKTVSGFTDNAIQSTHPYPEGTNYPGQEKDFDYYLRVPIIVSSGNSQFKYKDVAIVEKGESGSTFPQPEFYDYVVAEGSRDGLDWLPMPDGYDASYNTVWSSAFDNNQSGKSSMFVDHQTDLKDYFQPGDTILVRFRLHSDPLTNGWGWAIDNLSIQSAITGLGDLADLSQSDLKIYPNPATDRFAIDLLLDKSERVFLTIYNIQGQKTDQFDFGNIQEGQQHLEYQNRKFLHGLNIVKINVGNQIFVKKVLFQ